MLQTTITFNVDTSPAIAYLEQTRERIRTMGGSSAISVILDVHDITQKMTEIQNQIRMGLHLQRCKSHLILHRCARGKHAALPPNCLHREYRCGSPRQYSKCYTCTGATYSYGSSLSGSALQLPVNLDTAGAQSQLASFLHHLRGTTSAHLIQITLKRRDDLQVQRLGGYQLPRRG